MSGMMKQFSLMCLCHWVIRIWSRAFQLVQARCVGSCLAVDPPESFLSVTTYLLFQTACVPSCTVMSDSLRPHDGLPGFSLHGIFKARILEWVTISSSRGSSPPRDRTCVSCMFCIAYRFFTTAPPGSPSYKILFLAEYVQVNLKINCDSNKKRQKTQSYKETLENPFEE